MHFEEFSCSQTAKRRDCVSRFFIGRVSRPFFSACPSGRGGFSISASFSVTHSHTMYYTSLRRLSSLQGPRSLLNRSRRFSVQTTAMQSVSLSKRSALRAPSFTSRELQSMSSADLKNLMKENGLRYAGGKSTLVDRATRYVHQHPMTSGASFSSRLHPQLSSKGQRASVQRKPAGNASSLSKKSPSAQKSSAPTKGVSHQEIFGHDHDYGTTLAARAHFEGSSLSWAAPAPAPPVSQSNMFSSAQKLGASSLPHADTPVWNKANFGNDTFHKSYTIGAKYGVPHKDHHSPLKVLHQEIAKHTTGHTRSTPSATATAAALKAKPAASKASTVADIKAKHAATALQRKKATVSPSSTSSIFDLPKAAQPHLEKQMFQTSATALKAPVTPKEAVQPSTSASPTHVNTTSAPKQVVQLSTSAPSAHAKSAMSANTTAAPTASTSRSAKVNSSNGSMGRNEIKQTSHAEASSSSPPKSSSHASSSESKTGSSSSSPSSSHASSSGSETGSSSSSSSSSSQKKAENSDGWSPDKIPMSTSAFPAVLGLGVIAWFIAGKRDRWLEAEARKRQEELRLHTKRRSQLNEEGEEVVLL